MPSAETAATATRLSLPPSNWPTSQDYRRFLVGCSGAGFPRSWGLGLREGQRSALVESVGFGEAGMYPCGRSCVRLLRLGWAVIAGLCSDSRSVCRL